MREQCEVCNVAVVRFYQVRKKAVCRHCKKDFLAQGRFNGKKVEIDYKEAMKVLQSLANPANCPHCQSWKDFNPERRQFYCTKCNVWLEREK